VVAAFEAATGDISGGRFERELAASGSVQEFERRLHAYEADSGLMRFVVFDHGAWSRLSGGARKSRQYILGNSLIEWTMMKHDLGVGLNVPLRVLIQQPLSGGTQFDYDLPSSLLRRLGNAEVTAAAKKLDAKIAALAERVMGAAA
jgi:uncharacterized protein (DUF302 family)